jgi:predicted esterase
MPWKEGKRFLVFRASLMFCQNCNLEKKRCQCVMLELTAFLPFLSSVKFLSSPLLILHGEDDKTVPLKYGKQVNHDLSPHFFIQPNCD